MKTEAIQNDWDIAKDRLKQRWAQLTDEDLEYIEGQQEELLGRIQQRTGESRETIERAINEFADGCCN